MSKVLATYKEITDDLTVLEKITIELSGKEICVLQTLLKDNKGSYQILNPLRKELNEIFKEIQVRGKVVN